MCARYIKTMFIWASLAGALRHLEDGCKVLPQCGLLVCPLIEFRKQVVCRRENRIGYHSDGWS